MTDVDTSQFPTLYRGDSDSEPPSGWVTYLQQWLVNYGHDPGPVDGLFGPRTEAAVQSFQQANGCTADGVVGNQTWGALHGQAVSPGVNRTNPHGGGGGGTGPSPVPRGEMLIYFGTDPYYGQDDRIHFELVTTHGDAIPAGTHLAELSVRDPNGSELLMQNFPAPDELVPVRYVPCSSIPIGSPEVGTHTATIVLDHGRGDTRTFTFQGIVNLDQVPEEPLAE